MVTPPLCDPYVAHGWGIGKSENEYLWSAKVAMENARICMWNLPVTSFFLWISDWNESVDEGVEVDKYPEIVRIWRITCTKKRKNVGNHTCTLYIYCTYTKYTQISSFQDGFSSFTWPFQFNDHQWSLRSLDFRDISAPHSPYRKQLRLMNWLVVSNPLKNMKVS